jgi:ParB-like nuclease domain
MIPAAARRQLGVNEQRMRNRPRRAVGQQAFRRSDEILVGPRHRRERGDIAALAASIHDDTQLQPIVIRPAGTLFSSARRSQAFKLLGLTKLSVTINDRVDPTVGGRFAKCMRAVPENYRNSSGTGEWRAFEIYDDWQF